MSITIKLYHYTSDKIEDIKKFLRPIIDKLSKNANIKEEIILSNYDDHFKIGQFRELIMNAYGVVIVIPYGYFIVEKENDTSYEIMDFYELKNYIDYISN